jgi:tetratricopeptide (TPR) repeat protein
MCYWGVAFALGPNINAPITEDAAKEAYAAIGEARKRASSAAERERGYIEALANRYVADPKAPREPLDRAYADAMRALADRFPDDLDAATLFAQSLMDTSPWNYWNADGSPRPLTNEVVSRLESVLKRNPEHIGAIHLYIHAVEASPNPARGERYAERLAALVPGAGHLVHMPAHIYLRTGRYRDASQANRDAIAADEAYLAGNRAAGNMTYEVGYYPHNMHFLVTSASMEGRRADALTAAEQVRANAHADMLRDPAMGGMIQHMQLTPLFTKVRFAMWEEVLAEPAPPQDLPYMAAISHAARGLALTTTGQLDAAQRELSALSSLRDEASLKGMYVSSVNTAAPIVGIAYEVLAGRLAAARRNAAEASRHMAAAVAIEDGLTYMEPPDWPIPVRQLQGDVLLELGRARDAEAAFRGDLVKFPENGWSLSGLRASLERQGKAREAAEVQARLARAWQGADVQLAAARVTPP